MQILRYMSGLTIFIMVTAILAGCFAKKEDESLLLNNMTVKDTNLNLNGFPVVKEKITLTGVGIRSTNEEDWNRMLVFQEYEKMTNIAVTWQTFPQSSFIEKRDELIASGDLPDLFLRPLLNSNDELKLGRDGTIVPLNELIKKYAPSFTSIIAKNPEILKNITKGDGKIYTLPQLRDTMESRISKCWINKKWLDNIQMKVPATTDELYNVLKAFQERDPNGNGKQDEIPFSAFGTASGRYLSYFLGYWGFGNTTGMTGNLIDVDNEGKIRFIAEDPKYREVLIYLNKLWREGLFDKDFFKKLDGSVKPNSKDQIGCFPGAYEQNGSDDYVSLPVLKGPYGDQVHNVVNSIIQNTGTFAITKNNKYPEATMRWIDYFYSLEGTALFRMGVEGKTYKKLSSGTMEYMDVIANYKTGWSNAIARFTPGPSGSFPQFITIDTDKYITPAGVEFTKPLIPYISKEIMIPQYTPEQLAELNGDLLELSKYIRETTVKFITGDESFAYWDNYLSKLKDLKSERYKQIYEDVYKKWKGVS